MLFVLLVMARLIAFGLLWFKSQRNSDTKLRNLVPKFNINKNRILPPVLFKRNQMRNEEDQVAV